MNVLVWPDENLKEGFETVIRYAFDRSVMKMVPCQLVVYLPVEVAKEWNHLYTAANALL